MATDTGDHKHVFLVVPVGRDAAVQRRWPIHQDVGISMPTGLPHCTTSLTGMVGHDPNHQ